MDINVSRRWRAVYSLWDNQDRCLASNSLYQVFYVRLRETAQNKSNHTVAEATNPEGETARQEERKNRSTQQAKTISKVALESPYLATIT